MNSLDGVWKFFNRLLPHSKDIVSHNLHSEIESAKDSIGNTHSELKMSQQKPDDVVENVYDRPHVKAMIRQLFHLIINPLLCYFSRFRKHSSSTL